MLRRHEKPLRRVNPSGRVVWVARWTDRAGKRRSAGTFPLRGPCRAPTPEGSPFGVECCAQHAIDAAYDDDAAGKQPIVGKTVGGKTVGQYAKGWIDDHPRAARTNTSYNHRVGRVLDVEIEGLAFRHWPMLEFRRRHVISLLDHLLRVQGRSQKGAVGVLRVLSAMWSDALDDECAEVNPFIGVKVRANDPRITKPPRRISVYSWKQMRRFAAAAKLIRTDSFEPTMMDRWRRTYAEAMVRVLSDCGLRLGEMLALQRSAIGLPGRCMPGCDLPVAHLHVTQTAHEGEIQAGTKTDHGEATAGRVAPLPEETRRLLDELPRPIGVDLLFPTPRGKVWRESLFYRELWWPTQAATGLQVRPQEMRHSWVTHLRAAGINPDELAKAAGHTVATQHAHYTHPQGAIYDLMNRTISGEP